MSKLKKLYKEIEQLSNYKAIVAYGIGYYDGDDAVFIYWDSPANLLKMDIVVEKLPKEIAGYKAINKSQHFHKVVVSEDNKYIGQRCHYWIGDNDFKEFFKENELAIPDKYAYPMFKNKKGLEVIYIDYSDFGKKNFNSVGRYEDSEGRFDWIEDVKFIKTKIKNSTPHSERNGWCYQLDIEDEEYPLPQYNIAFSLEEAKEEVMRRIKNKMHPLEKSLEYLKTIKNL